MKLKGRILTLVSIPLAGLAVIAAGNGFMLRHVAGVVNTTVDQNLLPIIADEVPRMNELSNSIEYLLNADRDAYQGYMAEMQVLSTQDETRVTELIATHATELGQVAHRVEAASAEFDDAGRQTYTTFGQLYGQWKQSTDAVMQTSLTLARELSRRRALHQESIQTFSAMRQQLDDVVGLLEAEIESLRDAEDKTRLLALHEAVELLLNADRDAYQGLVAMIEFSQEADRTRFEALVSTFTTELGQVRTRIQKASEAFNEAMHAEYRNFLDTLGKWDEQCRQVASITEQNIDRIAARQSEAENSLKAFAQMRGTIDTMSGQMEERIAAQMAAMAAQGETAQAEATALNTSMDRANTLSLIAAGAIFVFALGMAVWRIRQLVATLTHIMQQLFEGSEQVVSASNQISSASQSLAEGATEQAAGLQETSSSLEEMASMTKQNANNAQQANVLSTETRKAADTGAASMARMNSAIQDIQRSSDETAKIIKVIDDIAFQTNLLALNAAVEAARAGEAGKGFAVVAEEVRNLAMRSAEAAKNTSGMIEESVKNAKTGVDIAEEVGTVLNEIVQSIGKTTNLVSEIAAASQEQAQGIDQVNTAVSQMDKVTQQNAANAEESASASEELSAQAEGLNEIVDQLVRLVGDVAKGSDSGSGRHAAAGDTRRTSRGLTRSDATWHQIAGADKHTGQQHPSARPAPSRVIPLDDDADLDQFNR